MGSLREGLAAAGLTVPFSLRHDLETYPRSLREIIRILHLPPMELGPEGYEELWQKTGHRNAQGVACIDSEWAVITIEKKLFLTRTTTKPYRKIAATFDVAHFAEQTNPQLDDCNHFSDPDFRDGLIFFLFEVSDKPGALFACDLDFKVVGFTEIDEDASNSCCAFNPWNGLLYVKDTSKVWAGKRLRAYDVSGYFARHQGGWSSEWGKPIPWLRREDQDIELRYSAGVGMAIGGDIQGIAFSPNGRLYLPYWIETARSAPSLVNR